jgi:hypothetical protein
MPVKIHFDRELSLKLCPPEKRPDVPDGAIWVKRIVLSEDKVTYRTEDQSRVVAVDQDNASQIKVSMEKNGFLHTEYPPVIYENPDKKDDYFGLVGFTRDQVLRMLGWTHMIYDVYRFESPLAKLKMASSTNIINNPRKGNTKKDIINQTLKAIEQGALSNVDSDIIDFINFVASDKSEKEKNTIFKNVRQQKSSHPSIITYHCGKGKNSTEEFAKKYDVAYKGDKSPTGKLGYIPPYSEPKTNFVDSKKLLVKYGWQDIEFRFFLPEAVLPPKLYVNREEHLSEFHESVLDEAKFLQLFLRNGYSIDDDVQTIASKLPWKYKGFLAQYKAPDSSKEGNPTEIGVVNIDGTPY